MPSRRLSILIAAAALAVPGAALADEKLPGHGATPETADFREYVAGASRLEGRLLAPCCWNQTLDIHASEPTYQLRSEIRRRLKAGESPDAIEQSIVQRYGQKILAVPDSSPLVSVANLLGLGFAGAGVAAYFMLKRWRVAGAASAAADKKKRAKADAGAEPKRDALDERLDRELEEIENKA
jgi:cytochrome c-type biogenesis protein CcmH